MSWLKRLLHRFDVLCPECREVLILPWNHTCSFCDPGEGKVQP